MLQAPPALHLQTVAAEEASPGSGPLCHLPSDKTCAGRSRMRHTPPALHPQHVSAETPSPGAGHRSGHRGVFLLTGPPCAGWTGVPQVPAAGGARPGRCHKQQPAQVAFPGDYDALRQRRHAAGGARCGRWLLLRTLHTAATRGVWQQQGSHAAQRAQSGVQHVVCTLCEAHPVDAGLIADKFWQHQGARSAYVALSAAHDVICTQTAVVTTFCHAGLSCRCSQHNVALSLPGRSTPPGCRPRAHSRTDPAHAVRRPLPAWPDASCGRRSCCGSSFLWEIYQAQQAQQAQRLPWASAAPQTPQAMERRAPQALHGRLLCSCVRPCDWPGLTSRMPSCWRTSRWRPTLDVV